MRFSLVLAILAMSTAAFSQGLYQIGFAANLNIGDSVVNLSNDGINGGFFGATPPTLGNICANIYVFDPREEEIGCCACLVTPNGLNSLSVKSDLISNNLTPDVPTSVVIKVLGTRPTTTPAGDFTICNPATAGITAATALVAGTNVWGATLEPAATPGTYATVNVPFHDGFLISGFRFFPPGPAAGAAPDPGTEQAALTTVCNFIQSNGSGFGICKSCRLGALGGAKQ